MEKTDGNLMRGAKSSNKKVADIGGYILGTQKLKEKERAMRRRRVQGKVFERRRPASKKGTRKQGWTSILRRLMDRKENPKKQRGRQKKNTG